LSRTTPVDLIEFDGRWEALYSNPLYETADPQGIDTRSLTESDFHDHHSWHQGFWAIRDNWLYLIGLFERNEHPLDPRIIFPGSGLPQKATWLTGRLDIDRGPVLATLNFSRGRPTVERVMIHLACGRILRVRRYDQRKHFLRYWADVARMAGGMEAYFAWLRERYESPLGLIGGFSAAGLELLGIDASQNADLIGVHDEPYEDSIAFLEPMLPHLVRPGASG